MEESDVLSALESLSCRQRAEGQTAFPDWPTILCEIEEFARRRRIADSRAAKAEDMRLYEQRIRDNPEEFVAVADVWAEVRERIAKKESAA